MRVPWRTVCLAIVVVNAATAVGAEPPDSGSSSDPRQTASDIVSLTRVAPGLTPYSDYSGDFFDRATLTGDWGGFRTKLYESGVTLDVVLTQTYQYVASGGVDGNDNTYTGLLDYGASFDTGKLGLWPAGLFVFNGQTGFAGNDPLAAGTVSPTNMITIYPTPEKPDTFLMEYYWMQGVAEGLAVLVGRLNPTSVLDRNRFADNPRNQFMNLSMNNSPLVGGVISFSTYGIMAAWQVTDWLSINPAIYEPNVQPDDWGSSSDRDFFEDIGVAVEVGLEWTLAEELSGAMRIDGIYTNAKKTALDNPRLPLDLVLGISPKQRTGNWVVNVNLEQYLWKPKKLTRRRGFKSPEEVPNEALLRSAALDFQAPGLGVFAKFTTTPDDRNPFNIYLMGGVGGRGVVPGRPYDRLGVGAFWLKESSDLAEPLQTLLDDEVGFEVFYNVAITPAIQLTFDLQWIDPGVRADDETVVFGMRLATPF